jgi:uncharacterized Zn finger protein
MLHMNKTATTTATTTVHCPTCGVPQVTEPAAKETTYLRCASCGEVWNALRYHAPRPWAR